MNNPSEFCYAKPTSLYTREAFASNIHLTDKLQFTKRKETHIMKAYEIASIIEKEAPLSLAYSWDNVGILCGDSEKEIKKALLTLDVNEFTVNEAIQNNCGMIISHHPILLGGIKRIDFSTSDGRMLKNLIKNEIVVFSAHTNMDTAKNGINTVLADIFELTDAKILEENGEETGLGRYGNLQKSVSLDEFCETVKTKLNTPHVRVCGDLKAKIKTVAVASGSCSDIIPLAKEKGCDVIITADMKYHNAMDSVFSGISVIDAGHYPTEIIVMDIFEKLLKNTEIETVKSQNKDIFIYK